MKFEYVNLIRLGVYIGHNKAALLYSAWMVAGFRGKMVLMNLYKFVKMFRIGFSNVDGSITKYRPVWFLNGSKMFKDHIAFFASQCGEFYSSEYWIRGMLSNFRVVNKAYLKYSTKTKLAFSRKRLRFNINYEKWLFTRFTWPGVVFVTSVLNSYFMVNEARYAKVPCIGIVDSDAASQGCTIAVPGNDDSLVCVIFYNRIISDYIIYKKFLLSILWFFWIRKGKRLLSFVDWFFVKSRSLGFYNLSFFKNKTYSRANLNAMASEFLFKRDSWFKGFNEFLFFGKNDFSFFWGQNDDKVTKLYNYASSYFCKFEASYVAFLSSFVFLKKDYFLNLYRKRRRKRFKFYKERGVKRIFFKVFRQKKRNKLFFKLKNMYFFYKVFWFKFRRFRFYFFRTFAYYILVVLFSRLNRSFSKNFFREIGKIFLIMKKNFYNFLISGLFNKRNRWLNRKFLFSFPKTYVKSTFIFHFKTKLKFQVESLIRFNLKLAKALKKFEYLKLIRVLSLVELRKIKRLKIFKNVIEERLIFLGKFVKLRHLYFQKNSRIKSNRFFMKKKPIEISDKLKVSFFWSDLKFCFFFDFLERSDIFYYFFFDLSTFMFSRKFYNNFFFFFPRTKFMFFISSNNFFWSLNVNNFFWIKK
jgi:small subunit ribosomal protein S2